MRGVSSLFSYSALLAAIVALLAASCAPATTPGGTSGSRPEAPKPAEAANRSAGDEFYRGKVITLVVGSTAGGGYDTYSRALARHVRKYIPGEPNVIVDVTDFIHRQVAAVIRHQSQVPGFNIPAGASMGERLKKNAADLAAGYGFEMGAVFRRLVARR